MTETSATPVWSVDPRTGSRRGRVAAEAGPAEVDAVVRAAHATRGALADRARRIAFLRAAAEGLGRAEAGLVATLDAETALGPARLTGELARTRAQLRAFADTVEAGAYLDVRIDRPDPTATPPRPDLRRFKVPLGVVGVWAASNFPLAFSVPGGDTASALAAGCPVVVKAHPDHPEGSELCAEVLRAAALSVGLPAEVVGLVHGFDAGLALIAHPLLTAAGFTGSPRGGRALFDAAAARPVPIPFHGELGSLNPVVVSAAAAEERAEAIGTELAGAVALGHGQFCVKPGLVLVPAGPAGDRLVGALAKALGAVAPGVLLDARMAAAYREGVARRAALPGVTLAVDPDAGPEPAGVPAVGAGLLVLESTDPLTEGPEPVGAELLEECFGPVTTVARYRGPQGPAAVLARVPGSLSAVLYLSEAETRDGSGPGAELLALVSGLAGRVVVNGIPNGVAVAPAQHHGGPWPAATSHATSVGEAAIERWLRPVAHQSVPDALLPPELREANPLGLPRRVTPGPS
ncbi:aldehyde dehydrogenase family protein [Streptomyces sp. BI20]|uniref:aldehyde dehydrogenase family protein n=1 Tax=Streptomyces sp. BI20 TaxID=3403460 RepID=UPI003C750420